MIIGVDMDGVVADLHPKWIHLINEDLGTSFECEDFDHWCISCLVGDDPADLKRARRLLNKPDLYKYLDVIPDSYEVLKKLYDEGHEIVFISRSLFNNNAKILADKIFWIKNNFSFIDVDKCIFTNNKELITVDIIIDDSIYHLTNNKNSKHKILYLDYHNTCEIDTCIKNDIVAIPNWIGIYDYIQSII